jgi:hypothetical protein
MLLAPIVYWLLRRRCLRRMAVARRPFPTERRIIWGMFVAAFREYDKLLLFTTEWTLDRWGE